MEDDHDSPPFTFKLTKTRYAPSPSSEYHITFNFKFEIKISKFIVNQVNEVVLTRQAVETLDASARIAFPIHPDKTSDEIFQLFADDTLEFITTILARLPIRVSDNELQKLVDFAISEADQVAMNRMFYDYRDVDIYILAEKEDQFVYYVYEENSCMVPATNSSVQLLLKKCDEKKIDSDQSCCICCEELGEGDQCDVELLSMPCEHVFHGDCIKKWLKSSHYCPLCRFEMPTEMR